MLAINLSGHALAGETGPAFDRLGSEQIASSFFEDALRGDTRSAKDRLKDAATSHTNKQIHGIADEVVSDDMLRDLSAAALGVPTSEVTVLNRQMRDGSTLFLAVTENGLAYSCVVDAGRLASGARNPIECNRSR